MASPARTLTSLGIGSILVINQRFRPSWPGFVSGLKFNSQGLLLMNRFLAISKSPKCFFARSIFTQIRAIRSSAVIIFNDVIDVPVTQGALTLLLIRWRSLLQLNGC